jgi:1-acyl-sn-glycerol-3-phosphate acyltransferase
MAGRFLRWIFNLLFALLTRREVHGRDNLPARGPYILASNHLSIFDPPLIYGLIGGPHMTGWAGEKWERHLIFGPILRMGQGIFIQRGQVDRHAIDAAVQILQQGRIFGVAPEGTRSRTGGLIRGKSGVAYLARRSMVPIAPMAITGTESLGRQLLRLRRPHLVVRFGTPFTLEARQSPDRTVSLRQDVDEVMCRIAALLPPAYRGVYANHPRLKHLLAEAT